MSARKLGITPEQAAALLPLLREIVSEQSTIPTGISPVCVNIASSPESDSSAVEDHSCVGKENTHYRDSERAYKMEDLLRKKKKNSKSTMAQNFIHYTIREAAKVAGLWEKAPYMNQISSTSLSKFYKCVFDVCPKLRPEKKIIRKRLSDTLMNRRAHLRSLKVLSPKKRRLMTTEIETNPTTVTPRQEDQSMSSAGSIPAENDHDSLLGLVMDIRFEQRSIGSGVLMSIDDEIFATIILKSKRDDIDDINLYEPVGSKTLFKDLQMAESFKWKQVNLIDKTSKKSMADMLSSSSKEMLMPTEIETNPTTVTPRQENQSMSSGGSIYIHAENDYDSLLGLTMDIQFEQRSIGSGVLMSIDDEIFATIILKSKRDDIDDINLYEPVGSKTLFKDLQMAESFKWKQVNLIDKTSKKSMADMLSSSSKEIWFGKISAEEYDEDETIGNYEKERLKRIKTNKRVLKEIMNLHPTDNQDYVANSHAKTTKTKEKRITPSCNQQRGKRKSENENSTSKKVKKTRTNSKHWAIIDSDDEEWSKDYFNATEVEGKRQRKPTFKLF